MNKIYFFTLAVFCLFVTTTANAQAAKLAFVEEFTQASCGPCAGQNPAFDALLDGNEENVVVLKYQTVFPGFDPMNQDNPEEVETRWDYYTFTGVPSGAVDGSSIANDCSAYVGAPACLSQADIDEAVAVGSAFEIEMAGGIVDGILTVTGTITAVMDAEATTPVFRVAMTERTISYDDAPGGNNGETEYNHVMKKFLTGTAGDALPTTWASGDTFDFEYTLNTADVNIYQFGQVRVVGFIQDDANRYVHQAATVNPDITVSFTNNAGVVAVTELPAGVCPGESTITPSAIIVNGGNEELNTADIVYSVNGGAEQTYIYTGSLATLGQETVLLDPITFSSSEINTVEVTIINPNGQADEDTVGDTATGEVALAPVAGTVFTVTLTPDCWGEEASWEFVDDSGAVVASSPSYAGTTAGEAIAEEVTLDFGGCYSFRYVDSYGDGLNGSQWTGCDTDGSLLVTDAEGYVVYDYDGSFDVAEAVSAFGTTSLESAVEVLTSLDALNLYPNPVSSELNVDFSLAENMELNVTVLNAMGQVIERNNSSFAAGANYINVNTAKYANGIYFLQIEGQEGVKTAKFTVSK